MSTLRDIRTFPGLLADLREEAGWSQSRLGAEAGVDSSFICKLEAGDRPPVLHLHRGQLRADVPPPHRRAHDRGGSAMPVNPNA
jgi:DNA-binding XRE family transcriptional regulator